MRYFRSDGNDVYAYENDADVKYMKNGLMEITEQEAVVLATPEQNIENVIVDATTKKSILRLAADDEIAWLQDAVDVGIATAKEADLLVTWKKYRVLLMRVDTTNAPEIEWPISPVCHKY